MPPKTCVFPLRAGSAVGDIVFFPFDEGEQLRVDLILMRGGDAVRRARVVDVLRALDESSRLYSRVFHRNDLVVLAVKYQSRYIKLLEVLGEVGLRECLDALVSVLQTGLHAPGPKLIESALGDASSWPIGTIKRDGKISVCLRAVLHEARTYAVEQLDRQAVGIGGGFQHERWHGGDQDGLGYSARSIAADVARDFSASGGVAHQGDLIEIEGFDHCRKIVGIAIHVIAGRSLAGSPVPTTVVRDYAKAVLRQEEHLSIPHVGVQRPAMRERNGRASAPVLVVNLRSIFRGDNTHLTLPSWCLNTM